MHTQGSYEGNCVNALTESHRMLVRQSAYLCEYEEASTHIFIQSLSLVTLHSPPLSPSHPLSLLYPPSTCSLRLMTPHKDVFPGVTMVE